MKIAGKVSEWEMSRCSGDAIGACGDECVGSPAFLARRGACCSARFFPSQASGVVVFVSGKDAKQVAVGQGLERAGAGAVVAQAGGGEDRWAVKKLK